MNSGSVLTLDLGQILGLSGSGAIYTSSGEFCFQPVGTQNELKSFVHRATLSNSYWYLQQLVSWLATGKDTGNAIAVMELTSRQGLEPPPHVHTREDELYFVMDGTATFFVGEELVEAAAGDAVLLPRGVRHWHKLRTPKWRALVAMTPAGLEDYYAAFSHLAGALSLPSPEEDPIDFGATVPRLVELGAQFGIWYPPVR